MTRKNISDLITFFEYVLRLKSVNRAGWISKVKISDAESVADHSFSACAISMTLSDMLGLDTERVVRMVILHDLAESITGDYLPGEVDKNEKVRKENKAMKAILRYVPRDLSSEYEGIWKEYLLGKTEISRLVHEVDKLEMALQARQYRIRGYSHQILSSFFNFAKKSIKHDNHEIISYILNALEPPTVD
jgi:putative hydrolases of HD superfamily